MGLFGDLFGDDSGSEEALQISKQQAAQAKAYADADIAKRNEIAQGLQPLMANANATDATAINNNLGVSADARANSKTLWDRYMKNVAPVEDQYFGEALTYGNEADQNRAAGRAVTDVNQQRSQQMDATNRNLTAMGVNPNSARFAAQNRMQELTAMAQGAGAATNARETTRLNGINLRGTAVGLGKTQLDGSNALAGTSIAGANAASGIAGNGVNRGLAVGNFQTAGYANGINATNGATGNMTQAAQSKNTSGLMPGLLGFGASIAMAPENSWIGQKLK